MGYQLERLPRNGKGSTKTWKQAGKNVAIGGNTESLLVGHG